MLFRSHFTDEIVKSIARALVKEPDFKSRGAIFDYVKEDLEVMTDAELQIYMATYKVTGYIALIEAASDIPTVYTKVPPGRRLLSPSREGPNTLEADGGIYG